MKHVARAVRLEDERVLLCPYTGKVVENPSRMYEVGKEYALYNGVIVKVISEKRDVGGHYDHILCSDGVWRYDRKNDRGRCTGGSANHPRNLVRLWPEEGDETWRAV